jgi:hypothetical protein
MGIPRRDRNAVRLDEHRVAVAEESIPAADRMPVCVQHALAPGEGAHQHEQTRFRQMEVRQQGVDHPKAMTGPDEESRLALLRRQLTASGGGLEGAHAGRADRDDPATLTACLRDLRAERRRNAHHLGMHVVRIELVRAHRLKRARTHVQRQMRGGDPRGGTAFEQGSVEMQTRGRRRHGARHPRIHRLIALAVDRLGGAVKIGRQRDLAVPFEDRQRLVLEADLPEFVTPTRHDGAMFPGEHEPRAWAWRLAGAKLRQDAVRIDNAL